VKMNMDSMTSLFEPRSIAVIGATATEGKSGYFLLQNLIRNGYAGKIYPINPNIREVFGYKAFSTILNVPDKVDLAFVLIPDQFVKETLRQCSQKGVKSVVIVSAGFGEVGEEGVKEQKDLEGLIKRTGLRCLGPNTVGLVNVQKNLFGSFVPFENWLDGPVAIGAQSGIFAGALANELMFMKTQRIGICKSLSLGNMMDIDETDFLEYAWKDPACKIIAFYLESIKRPRTFLALANKVKKEKPIIVLKSGRTDYGARAALSHTGSLAIKDDLVDISFRQYGIIRTYTLQEFLCTLRGFAYQPLPRGDRIGVITYSGANGVMASDEIYYSGLKLAEFKEETLRRIKNIMPEWQPIRNPADLWVALGVGRNENVYGESMSAVLEDENVDALLCLLLGLPNSDTSEIREVFANAMADHPEKPIFIIIFGGKVKERWINELEGLNLPIYPDTSLAVKTIKAMHMYYSVRDHETLSSLMDPKKFRRAADRRNDHGPHVV